MGKPAGKVTNLQGQRRRTEGQLTTAFRSKARKRSNQIKKMGVATGDKMLLRPWTRKQMGGSCKYLIIIAIQTKRAIDGSVKC